MSRARGSYLSFENQMAARFACEGIRNQLLNALIQNRSNDATLSDAILELMASQHPRTGQWTIWFDPILNPLLTQLGITEAESKEIVLTFTLARAESKENANPRPHVAALAADPMFPLSENELKQAFAAQQTHDAQNANRSRPRDEKHRNHSSFLTSDIVRGMEHVENEIKQAELAKLAFWKSLKQPFTMEEKSLRPPRDIIPKIKQNQHAAVIATDVEKNRNHFALFESKKIKGFKLDLNKYDKGTPIATPARKN